ncbi:MAG: PAP/fibrillin family protein [Polyangiaceae bacterium]
MHRFPSFGALLVLLSVTGCAQAVDESTGDTSAALSDAARIDALKCRIRSIATANTTRSDNVADVEAELSPLVAELAALEPARTETETVDKLEGVWRSLWNNLRFDPPNVDVDETRTYQVVTKDGYYYNLSNSTSFGFLKTVGVLRGAYASDGNGGFDIEFTANGFRLGELRGDLFALAQGIEARTVPVLYLPGRVPNGPVGVRASLTTIYVDDDLRIAGGWQVAIGAPSGGPPARANFLAVFDRQTSPLP